MLELWNRILRAVSTLLSSGRRTVDRRIVGAGIAAWALAFLLAAAQAGPRWLFIPIVFLIPISLGVLLLQERQLPIWGGTLPLYSTRGISYAIAFLATLFWPWTSLTVFQTGTPMLAEIGFAFYAVSVFGVWTIALFFSGKKQPTMEQGRYVPLLYSFMGFTLAMFL